MTYRKAREKAAQSFAAAGIEEAENQSRLLLEYVTRKGLAWYLANEENPMPPEQEKRYADLAEQRVRRIPLQYLTGEQEFMGLPFFVSEEVLIPRQDTELLAETAIRFLREEKIKCGERTEKSAEEGGSDFSALLQSRRPPRVLDLCTGSGCLAISLACFCPEAEVCGSDVSEAALRLAEKNAARNGTHVAWIESDLFSSIDGKFDLIVCNPPYIPTAEIAGLMPEVRDFEPSTALDGGADGLSFYRAILAACGEHLKPGGGLFFEIGCGQGAAVCSMMEEHDFVAIQVIPDLAGLDRVVTGRKQDV